MSTFSCRGSGHSHFRCVHLSGRRRGRLSSRRFSNRTPCWVRVTLDGFVLLLQGDGKAAGLALRGPRFSLLVRRQGALLLAVGGFLVFALVALLVFPRTQCQVAGLASPKDSILVFQNHIRCVILEFPIHIEGVILEFQNHIRCVILEFQNHIQ